MSLDSATVSFVSEIRNPLLDSIMKAVTHLGSFEFVLITSLFLLWKNRDRGIMLSTSTSISLAVVMILKNAIARPRPIDSIIEVGSVLGTSYSFPSGHSALAFATAFVLAGIFGKKPVFFTIAGIVAISRVYLGVHYLSDIIAGSIIGGLIGYTIMNNKERVIGVVNEHT